MGTKGMNVSEADRLLKALERQTKKLDTLTQSVGGLKAPLESVWEGKESAACVAYLGKLTNTMTNMSTEVTKIHDWAKKVRDGYEEAASKGEKAYNV
jgi:uncharacterized protein YukE